MSPSSPWRSLRRPCGHPPLQPWALQAQPLCFASPGPPGLLPAGGGQLRPADPSRSLPLCRLDIWFGHQAATDVAFTDLLPLTLTWTRSDWALAGTFCHLDPGLAFLTYAGGRLLTRRAADRCASLRRSGQPGRRATAVPAGRSSGFGLLVLVLGTLALWAPENQAAPGGWTPARGLPHRSSEPAPRVSCCLASGCLWGC